MFTAILLAPRRYLVHSSHSVNESRHHWCPQGAWEPMIGGDTGMSTTSRHYANDLIREAWGLRGAEEGWPGRLVVGEA